jgi:phosphopantetheinyl transferase
MDFRKEKINVGTSTVCLLHYDIFDPFSFSDQLTSAEMERLFSFKHISRKREFVAVRILRNELFGHEHIHYNVLGAPYIDNYGFISISHTGLTAGLAVNNFFHLGFDVELICNKATRVHKKFLSDDECKVFDITSDEEMTRCWSAKECLYKLAGQNQIDFKRDLGIRPKNENIISGYINSRGQVRTAEIHTFVHENLIVSVNVTPLK